MGKQPLVLLRDRISPLEWELFAIDQANVAKFYKHASEGDGIQHAALATLAASQTIIFDSRLAIEVAQKQPAAPYDPLPFPATTIQFTKPIPVANEIADADAVALPPDTGLIAYILTTHPPKPPHTEPVTCCFIATQHYAPAQTISFFQVLWLQQSKTPFLPPKRMLSLTDIEMQAYEAVTRNVQNLVHHINHQVDLEPRTILAPKHLAMKNKRPQPRDYYICAIKPTPPPPPPVPEQTPAPSEPSGRHVSIEFDVRGFWRHYKSGKVSWVPAHRRGIGHPYVPKVYELPPPPTGKEHTDGPA